MKYHAGILDGRPEWDRVQALVLAHTPGVPIEWIYAGLGLGHVRRRHLRAMIAGSGEGEWPEIGRANFASMEQGDGWRMIEAVCPAYAGPAPLWTQLELRNDRRSDAEIARVLGVDRKKVWRWRVNAVFDPLTGVRIRPNRGVNITNCWGSVPLVGGG
jgi:hypothetical protein